MCRQHTADVGGSEADAAAGRHPLTVGGFRRFQPPGFCRFSRQRRRTGSGPDSRLQVGTLEHHHCLWCMVPIQDAAPLQKGDLGLVGIAGMGLTTHLHHTS